MGLLAFLSRHALATYTLPLLQAGRLHVSRKISSGVTVRGEGGVASEGRLVGNESFIPGVGIPWH